MSPQIIELLIFAGVAFFIINKLISVLGTTNTRDNDRSRFGEPSGMKDITHAVEIIDASKKQTLDSGVAEFFVTENKDEIASYIELMNNKIRNFDVVKFISGSRGALKILVNALSSKDEETISALVDKRFMSKFLELNPEKYSTVISSNEDPSAKISDIYTFGNNVFIKVLFFGVQLKEEWTFCKNSNDNNPNWQLSNIESAQ
jgi:predicted lipid-binding transport protein (Tim44 family)